MSLETYFIDRVEVSEKRYIIMHLPSYGTRAFSNEDTVYAYMKYRAASLRTQL